MNKSPITAVIVGAGHRALCYAAYAETNPDKLKIVGVADPLEYRRKEVAERFKLSEEQCFENADALVAKGKIADAAINGTMDADHVPTSIPLLKAGYDILLEKPFAITEEEVHELSMAAKKYGRKVMICHVLRYAPFYAKIKERLLNGEIGEVINIQTNEHVSYHHIASCFVRGKWNRKDVCGSSTLMSKCCHDLDLLMWMKSGIAPKKVSSFGSRSYFRQEKAPGNSGTHCLLDCPIEKDCLYSSRKHHLDHSDRWAFYVWAEIEGNGAPTIEDKEKYLLEKDCPYSRCVWKCDNNVVDRQSVMIEFEDGSTATHNLVGGTSKGQRAIHIVGTKGEIVGVIDESKFYVKLIDPRPNCECSVEEVDLNIHSDMTGAFGGHGGGDSRLIADFVEALLGETPSISCTSIEDSLNGHLVGFAADKAMENEEVVCL